MSTVNSWTPCIRLDAAESRHVRADWAFQSALLEHLESAWQQPDAGIWEMRGPPQHFTFSKVMAWVAFDRGLRTAEQFGLDGPLERWRNVRGPFTTRCASAGSIRAVTLSRRPSGPLSSTPVCSCCRPSVSCLLMTHAFCGTVAAIERELLVGHVVRRYNTQSGADGLPPGEGAFLACTLWLADAYVLLGRQDEARILFNHVLSLANDVGLLAEEYDPRLKRMVGNFPQAFSHVAVINTAHNLAQATKPAEQRAS